MMSVVMRSEHMKYSYSYWKMALQKETCHIERDRFAFSLQEIIHNFHYYILFF